MRGAPSGLLVIPEDAIGLVVVNPEDATGREQEEEPHSPLLGLEQAGGPFVGRIPGKPPDPATTTQPQSRCSNIWKRPWCRDGIVATVTAVVTIVIVVPVVWTLKLPVIGAAGNAGCCSCTSGEHSLSTHEYESLVCPKMWTRKNRTCYFQSKNRSDWKSAQEYCEAENGYLVILEELVKHQIVNLFFLRSDHWIGLKRHNDTEEWRWLNGSVYKGPVMHKLEGMACAYINAKDRDIVIGALDCSTLRDWLCMKTL